MRVVKAHHNEHPHRLGKGSQDHKYKAWFVGKGAGRGQRARPAAGPIVFVSRNPGFLKLYLQNYGWYRIGCHDDQKIYPHVGTYVGKTDVFDSLDYLHQRNRMHSNFGTFEHGSMKVGPKGHRVSIGNAINAASNVAGWIESPHTKIAEKVLSANKGYFLGLFVDERNLIFNHQTSCITLMPLRSKKPDGSAWTLNDLLVKLGPQMDQAFG